MSALERARSFIRRNAKVIGAVAVDVGGFIIARLIWKQRTEEDRPRFEDHRRRIDAELEASRREAELVKLAAERGREAMVAEAQREYAERMHALSEADRARAEELKHDPIKLSRFVLQAARRRPAANAGTGADAGGAGGGAGGAEHGGG